MKKIVLKTISFVVSFFNPGQLNSLYKTLSKFTPFKKSIYHIVKFTIPKTIQLENYQLYLNQKDAMVSGSLALNVYENYETEVFIQALKPGMVVIDIGANIGLFSLLAASRVKSVISFEPDTVNYALLTKNVTENHCTNVSCHQLAISDRTGELNLYENPENFGDRRIYSFAGAGEKVTVPTIALDDFLAQNNLGPVDFIKIDIQGAEGFALVGMDKTLELPHLQLLMEFFPSGLLGSGFDPIDILETLDRKQYKIFSVDGNKRQLAPVTDFPAFVSKFKNTDYTNLYCKK